MAKVVTSKFSVKLSKLVKDSESDDLNLEEGFEALIAETLENIFEGSGLIVEVEKGE